MGRFNTSKFMSSMKKQMLYASTIAYINLRLSLTEPAYDQEVKAFLYRWRLLIRKGQTFEETLFDRRMDQSVSVVKIVDEIWAAHGAILDGLTKNFLDQAMTNHLEEKLTELEQILYVPSHA